VRQVGVPDHPLGHGADVEVGSVSEVMHGFCDAVHAKAGPPGPARATRHCDEFSPFGKGGTAKVLSRVRPVSGRGLEWMQIPDKGHRSPMRDRGEAYRSGPGVGFVRSYSTPCPRHPRASELLRPQTDRPERGRESTEAKPKSLTRSGQKTSKIRQNPPTCAGHRGLACLLVDKGPDSRTGD